MLKKDVGMDGFICMVSYTNWGCARQLIFRAGWRLAVSPQAGAEESAIKLLFPNCDKGIFSHDAADNIFYIETNFA
ncbi:MAG: hypothetical protein JW807_08205 [Spirochaetes bacterium]|nr:hypothetical protein [Spirochaetota bacterium]